MPTPKTPLELDRNDLDGAIESYRHLVMTALTADELADGVQVLLSLQDDPDHLDNALEKVAAESAVAAALAKLGVE